jgi:cephalosporin-C deacetylase-like acetyl esterase
VITEGSLGGGLAQRQAALRDVVAAGARSISCLPTIDRAHRVPQKKYFLEISLN